jgi:hypothetical protein
MAPREAVVDGWAWFDAAFAPAPALDEVCRSAAACLGTMHGRVLLLHLERSVLSRRLPPTASDAELRHLEGQRALVGHLLQLVERGRNSPSSTIVMPASEVSP